MSVSTAMIGETEMLAVGAPKDVLTELVNIEMWQ